MLNAILYVIWLEIPALGTRQAIVGVPLSKQGWDVSWLGADAGWLQTTTYPGLAGNSVLTGHVYDANGQPGPFVNLAGLKWGDAVSIHTGGQVYRYEVRAVSVVTPDDLSALKPESQAWLTLITCRQYDEQKDAYLQRIVVRAVLVSVQAE
jgi:LPXTG-site transpeptidase (sortase) family protein